MVQHAGVQFIYFVRVLILARLLSPDDFGLMAIALVTVDILLGLTDVGMIPALVQREEVEDRQYDAAWTIGVVRALLVSVVLILAAPLIASAFAEPRAVPIMRGLAVRPVLDAVASMKVADLTRELRFRGLAGLHVGAATVNTVSSIALAPFIGVWALVLGAIAGATTYAFASYAMAPYRPHLRFDAESASALIHFGRWIFVIGISSLVSRLVLQAVISRRLGSAELGLYYLAARIAMAPTDVAYQLVGSVAFPLYSRLQGDARQAREVFRSVFIAMLALLLPALVLIFLLAPQIAQEVLGDRWAGAAPVIRVLCVAGFLGLYGDAVDPLFKGWGRPQMSAALDLTQTGTLVATVWFLTGAFGLPGAASAWIPAMGSTAVLGFLMARWLLPGLHVGLARPAAVLGACSLAGGVVASLLNTLVTGIWGLFLAIGAGGLASLFLILIGDRRLGIGLVEALERFNPRLGDLVGRLTGRGREDARSGGGQRGS